VPDTATTTDLIAELTELRSQVSDELTAMASAEDFDPDSREWGELQKRGERTDARLEALRKAQENRQLADEARDKLFRTPAARATEKRDVGEQVVRSEAFRTYLRNGMGGRAHLLDVALEHRALIDSTWMPGEVPRVTSSGPAQRTPLLNALTSVQVSNSSVELFIPPNIPTANNVPEGAQKPEAALSPQVLTVTLQTIAHWVEVTRRAIADESQLRDLLSSSLLKGLYKKAEQDAATAIQGGTYTAVTGSDLLKAIRVAVATVQSQGFDPNAVLINPLDAADLDYIIWGLGGSVTTTGSLFGASIITSPGITAGTAFVGDFTEGAKYLYRGSAQVYVSDSDVGMVAAAPVSNFKRNVLTFLAEMDAFTAITQTDAIVKASVGVTGAASAPRTHAAK
jgi:HK97 family phage major capsid protein